MIGWIAGRLLLRGADHVLIDVRGVGYIVYVSDRTLARMPGPGEAVELFTDLLVREDLLQLFGFSTPLEKEWHRLLISVQGVGAKASMAILGTLGVEGLARAIALGDWSAIKAAPGVGPKIAQRVIMELKAKAPSVMAMGAGPGSAAGALDDALTEPESRAPRMPQFTASAPAATAEAMSALGNLGYAPSDAATAVAQAVASEPEADTPSLIRAALRLLAPKG
jgi:Holliday junction DNA helicase RuvA